MTAQSKFRRNRSWLFSGNGPPPFSRNQFIVGVSDLFDCGCTGEIEARAKFDDRTNYKWLNNFRPTPENFQFRRKIEASTGIAFPEIDSGAKPVIFILALLASFAC